MEKIMYKIVNLLHEKSMKENDVYVLEYFNGQVLINDNYEGIIILDENLNIKSKIKLFSGLIISHVILCPFENRAVLYCPDNSIFVNEMSTQNCTIFLRLYQCLLTI
jgi:hypothetical protein